VASAFPRALQVRRHFRKENQPPHTQGFSNGINPDISSVFPVSNGAMAFLLV